MSYLWNEFNIKTFPAETIVYRDGTFCADLSTLPSPEIPPQIEMPIHIIYVGEIAGQKNLEFTIPGDHQRVFLSVKIKNNLPAFLNISIKNTGKNSEFRGGIIDENLSQFTLNILAQHDAPDTTLLIHSRVVAHENSQTKLTGTAVIGKEATAAVSDISFSALAHPSAKIEFSPAQRIASAPLSADHSAALYHPTAPQINFLRTAGLSTAEIKDALTEAFVNALDLF